MPVADDGGAVARTDAPEGEPRLREAVADLERALATLDHLGASDIAAAYITHAIDIVRESAAPDPIDPGAGTARLGETRRLDPPTSGGAEDE